MKFGCCLIVALLINFSTAFPQHGNFSGDKSLIMGNGADKSVEAYSMLSDDSSPGIQDGNQVGFVKNGLVNLTSNGLHFEYCEPPSCNGQAFGICYDAHSPDSAFIGSCSPSQCFLKIYSATRFENTYWDIKSSDPERGCNIFYIKPSAVKCLPKFENGMVQLNVLDYRCPVKAIDAQIKYPASTTLKPSQGSAQTSDETASASLWYQKWWFILIIVCLCLALITGVVAAIIFFYLKKRKAVKPPSAPFADAPTIETLFKESERKQSLKPPSPSPAQKKKSHVKKKKAVKEERERPFPGGDDTISYLESQGVRLDTSSYYIRNKSI